MKYKWFWLTLGFWFILGTAFSTWAFIYSPHHSDFKMTCRFEGETNGLKQTHEIEVSQSTLENVLIETSEQWRKEGWVSVTGDVNLVSLLLGLSGDETLLSSFLDVRLYQKNDLYRVLGLWNDSKKGLTYRWVVEMPKNICDSAVARSKWNFPLKPPRESFELYCGKFENLQIAAWHSSPDLDAENHFTETYSAQGFDGRLWAKTADEKIFILQKGKMHLLAVLKSESQKNIVSLVSLNKS